MFFVPEWDTAIMTNTIHPYHGRASGYNQAKDAAMSLFKPLSPEKEKEFQQTKAVLQQTLSAMKNSKNNMAQQKKAMAQQKLQYIKEAIKNLKQMAFTDPKAMARMAARLARELAAALKEYASAGATFTEIQNASGNAAATADQTANNASSTENGNHDAAPEMHLEIVDIPTSETETEPHENNPFKAYENTQKYGQESDKSDNIITTRRKDDDGEFIKEARKILDELRSIIKQQKFKLENGSPADQDEAKKADKALQEAEKAMSNLDATLGTTLTHTLGNISGGIFNA